MLYTEAKLPSDPGGGGGVFRACKDLGGMFDKSLSACFKKKKKKNLGGSPDMQCIVRGLKACHTIRTCSIFFSSASGKLTRQISAQVKGGLTPRRSNKNSGLIDLNSFFLHLPLLCKVQTKCIDSEEKQVILALRARVCHHTLQQDTILSIRKK